MSLIHEALKKAGGKNRDQSQPEELGMEVPETKPKRIPKPGRSKALAVLTLTALIVLIWSSYIYVFPHFTRVREAEKRPASDTQKRPTPFVKAELPKVAKLPSVDELNARAFEAFAKGDFTESVSFFSESIRIDNDQQVVRNNLGLALKKCGDLRAAESQYRYLVLNNSADSQTYNNLAVLLEETGREKEALQKYRKALEINPDYPEAHLNLALFLEKKRNLAEALIHYRLFLDCAGEKHYDLIREVSKHLKEIGLP